MIGLVGVSLGAWLTSRREAQHWRRDEQLKAAISFIGATGELYAHRRGLQADPISAEVRQRLNDRMQDGRSTFHLLCGQATIDLAEALVTRLGEVPAAEDGRHDPEMVELLRRLVQALRAELGSSQDADGDEPSRPAEWRRSQM